MTQIHAEAEHDVVGRHGRIGVEVIPRGFNPYESDRELHERLERQHRFSEETAKYNFLKEEYPEYIEGIHEWLEHEKEMLLAADVQVDDEMLAEAQILDEIIIAELRATGQPEAVVQVAEVLKGKVLAQHELDAFLARYGSAA